MLSAPTEPPEAILEPVLISAAPETPAVPAVDRPISVPESSPSAPVTITGASGKDAPAPEGELLKPASTSLGAAKSSDGPRKYIHLCKTGDTVENVAAAYGIEESALCALNNIRSGSPLGEGKALLLTAETSGISQSPEVTTYTVAAGDTFSKIARTFGIAASALMKMNSAASSSLQIGDVLYVPQK